MQPKHFFERSKVRLLSLGAIRSEMANAYRAWVRRELSEEGLKAGVYALTQLARVDEGALIERRLEAVEQQLATIAPAARPNGRRHHQEHHHSDGAPKFA